MNALITSAMPIGFAAQAMALVRRPTRVLHRLEDAAIVVLLIALVVIGVLDLELWRRLGLEPMESGELWIRHLTLLLGVVGGAVACREGQLLAITGLVQILPVKARRVADAFSGCVGSVVSIFLAAAAAQFASAEREAGSFATGNVPVWWFAAALAAGFCVLAVRLWLRSAAQPVSRAVTAVAVIAAPIFASQLDLPSSVESGAAFTALIAATLLGAPLFVVLGGAALIFFWSQSEPIASVAVDYYDQVTNPLLAMLPLFTLAGFVLASGKAAQRLIGFLSAWVGHIRGGAAALTILSCAFFTAFTGGSGVTILALGGLLLPILRAAGYSEKSAIGLTTGASSLGVLLPPCLPLVLYAIVGQVSIREMFLAAFLPAMLMCTLVMVWGFFRAPRRQPQAASFSLRPALAATARAKWELSMPVAPATLILGGIALPVTGAAVTALWAFIVQGLIHRELSFDRRFVQQLVECGMLIGGVLLVLGTAMGFTNFLITQHVPDAAASWLSATIDSRLAFLLLLNVFLLVVGCLMDVYSAIVVIVPLLVPVARLFGIDMAHLGVIVLANLELGYLTPPVGLNLFMAASRFSKPILEVARAAFPVMLVMLVAVLLITYWPDLSTWLPRAFGD